MTAAKTDPDMPWIIADRHYKLAPYCPLPALSANGQAENGRVAIRWVVPGTTWTCPECGLVYVAARTDRHTAMWISTGTQPGAAGDA